MAVAELFHADRRPRQRRLAFRRRRRALAQAVRRRLADRPARPHRPRRRRASAGKRRASTPSSTPRPTAACTAPTTAATTGSAVNADSAFASYYFNRLTVDPNEPRHRLSRSASRSAAATDGGETLRRSSRARPAATITTRSGSIPKHPEHMITAADQGTVVSVDGGAHVEQLVQPADRPVLPPRRRQPLSRTGSIPASRTTAPSRIASRSDYGAITFARLAPGRRRRARLRHPRSATIRTSSTAPASAARMSRWDARTGEVQNVSPWPRPQLRRSGRPTSNTATPGSLADRVLARTRRTRSTRARRCCSARTDQGQHWDDHQPRPHRQARRREALRRRRADRERALPCGYGVIYRDRAVAAHDDEIWIGTDNGLIQHHPRRRRALAQRHAAGDPAVVRRSRRSICPPLDPGTAYAAVDNHRQRRFRARTSCARTTTARPGRRSRAASRPAISSPSSAPIRSRAACSMPAPTPASSSRSTTATTGSRCSATCRPRGSRDLLVHGNDLIAATQGRAIWVLDDLACFASSAAPAAARAARTCSRRHRPFACAATTTTTRRSRPRPRSGRTRRQARSSITGWQRAAKGPVTLEIRDASGAVVRRFSSTDEPDGPSRRTLFRRRLGEAASRCSLRRRARTAGSGTCARPRPKAVAYNYIDRRGLGPEHAARSPRPVRRAGPLHGGADRRRPPAVRDLRRAPRSTRRGADYRAARAFSESLYDPMEKAWRGYAETKAVRDALDKRIAEIRDPALLEQAKALRTKLEPPTAPNAGFEGESGTLGLLETSAEGSDSAPAARPSPDRRPNRRRSEPRLGRVATDEGRGARAAQSPPCRRSPAADRRSCRSGAPRRSSRGRRRASLSEPPASLGDRLLRVILTAAL